MKKIVQLFLMVCMVLLGTQIAFANDNKVTLYEGADIVSVHSLALTQPRYTPIGKDAPTVEALNDIVAKAGVFSHCQVFSYDEVTKLVMADSGIDMKALNYRKSMKALKENVAKHADAYVVLTVANNSRTAFFFDVYKSGTNELLYTYQIYANKSERDNAETYATLSEQFFKNFERSVKAEQKKSAKNF